MGRGRRGNAAVSTRRSSWPVNWATGSSWRTCSQAARSPRRWKREAWHSPWGCEGQTLQEWGLLQAKNINKSIWNGRRERHGVDYRSGSVYHTFSGGRLCGGRHSGQRGRELPDRLKPLSVLRSTAFPERLQHYAIYRKKRYRNFKVRTARWYLHKIKQ